MGQAPAPGVNRPPRLEVPGFLLKEGDVESDRKPSHYLLPQAAATKGMESARAVALPSVVLMNRISLKSDIWVSYVLPGQWDSRIQA